MKPFGVVFTAVISSLAYGLPQGGHEHVLHEKRDGAPTHWTRVSGATGDTPLDLRIALKQNNLERAAEFMRDVSHPESKNFARFWSPERVAAEFASSEEAINDTVHWLLQMGVPSTRIAPSAGRNWIKVKNSTVAEAEKLLQTTYSMYQDNEGTSLVACESYSVPSSIQKHIDFVAPTIQFDTRVGSVAKLAKRQTPKVKPVNLASDLKSLDNCSNITTPACIRAIYGLPDAGEVVEGNSFGVVEFAPQTYNQTDLNIFFSMFTNVPNDTAPVINAVDGGYFENEEYLAVRGESDLDLCYAMSLVHPMNVTLYQVGDDSFFSSATNNNFLDAIDGSYCTFEGGDNPSYDAVYPHSGTPGAYTGRVMCGTLNATNVISVSYASNEGDRPASYRTRECLEYMKLGLMGVTVVLPSADYGVSGTIGQCLPDPYRRTTLAANPKFNPVFPSTCPWITSVGGSALPQGGVVGDAEVVAFDYVPGGGFSNLFELPYYQAEVMAKFYAEHDPGYNATHYNNSQAVRGYPDVAVSSQNFITGVDGSLQALSGTSAATPTFAAMIALINGERIKAGKGPVGFVNPTLYAHPEIFNDIVEGNIPGCQTDGFFAVDGWDPASGLGAPIYEKMKDVFMRLP
ncbi:peptidase S8/S53 domain-containing protein [Xylaria nigripes]|nr:peptidase S8/S53 domain-containing protein [Xylaria nigripes]